MARPHVLTFNYHEPYLCLMAKTGLKITVGTFQKPPYAREWQTRFRPIPSNITLVDEPEWRRELAAGHYDVVVAHNELNAANLFDSPIPSILVCHNRRTFLETTVSGDPDAGKRAYQKLLTRLQEKFAFVFISESKRQDYRIDGDVILPGIDVEEYGGYTGDRAEVLRVGNAMRARNLMFDVDLQERVCAGFSGRVLGDDPAIRNARPSLSFDDLLQHYRTFRCLLHVTREAYEDGYNLSTLEAMACGMPVVSLANRTSPITDGEDGFTSFDEEVLRARIHELLQDRDLAHVVGSAGRETVAEKFPISTFVERWNEVIERVAEHGSRPAPKKTESADEFPRTSVLLEYCASPFSTGRYIATAMEHDQNVVTTGVRIPAELIKEWGFAGDPPQHAPHAVPRFLDEPFSKVTEELPSGFNPALYLWIDSGVNDLAADLESLAIPRVCYIIDTHCSLHERIEIARRFNFTFLAQRTKVEDFVRAGVPNVAWLPLGCAPELHNVPAAERIYDVAFVGAIPDDPNDRRHKLIEQIRARFPNHKIGKFWPHEMAQIYAQSKIVFNVCVAQDINMRVFEGLASGALLVTDEADGLEELFRDREHLVIYRNDDQALDLIDHYLKHDAERVRIADAGKAFALAEHSYRNRTRQMILMVLDGLGLLGGLSGESRFGRGGYYRSPRPELQAHVPLRAQRVLDCGCGGGEFGMALKQRGAKVVCGIEIVERAYTIARRLLDHTILGNIEQLDLPWEDEFFDCIVFGDVLEHLIEPTQVLRKVSRVLAKDGVIVMSIPNIRFWQTVMMHANGRWIYEDAGIMDRTHLRFFCAPDMHQMVLDAGLELVKLQPLSMWPPDELKRDSKGCLRLGKVTIGPLDDAEYQDLLVYQYLVIAAKPGMDRLADARFALANNDDRLAYQLAHEATNADPQERARIMAKATVHTGELDKAEQLYRESVTRNPYDADAKAELGLLLVATNRFAEARSHLELALKADPSNDRAMGALGLIALAEGRIDEAMQFFFDALDAKLDNPALVLRLLDCAQGTRSFEAVLPAAKRYCDFYPGNVDVAYRLAEVLHASGQSQEAVDRLDTLLLLSPQHGSAKALRARIWESLG